MLSEQSLLERVENIRRKYGDETHGFSDIFTLLARIDELTAVVQKLPVTADGVPVVPGQYVFTPSGIRLRVPPFTILEVGVDDRVIAYPFAISDCYSSPEAAAAAREVGK